MSSEETPHGDQKAGRHSTTLIPVQVEHVDQLVLIARDLAGFVLLLDAAAIGDPTNQHNSGAGSGSQRFDAHDPTRSGGTRGGRLSDLRRRRERYEILATGRHGARRRAPPQRADRDVPPQ